MPRPQGKAFVYYKPRSKLIPGNRAAEVVFLFALPLVEQKSLCEKEMKGIGPREVRWERLRWGVERFDWTAEG